MILNAYNLITNQHLAYPLDTPENINIASREFPVVKEAIKLYPKSQFQAGEHIAESLGNHHLQTWIDYGDRLPGGLADGNSPTQFDPKQLRMGMRVEMEHTNDPRLAREIAMDHLREFPNYYTMLLQMESQAEQKMAKSKVLQFPERLQPKTPATTRDYYPKTLPEEHRHKYGYAKFRGQWHPVLDVYQNPLVAPGATQQEIEHAGGSNHYHLKGVGPVPGNHLEDFDPVGDIALKEMSGTAG